MGKNLRKRLVFIAEKLCNVIPKRHVPLLSTTANLTKFNQDHLTAALTARLKSGIVTYDSMQDPNVAKEQQIL